MSFAKGETFGTLTSQEALPSRSTSDVRAELEAKGLGLPAGERLPDTELADLSRLMYEALERSRTKWGEKTQGQLSWHHIFAAFDDDGSGFVTLAEASSSLSSP